jgi:sugar phosphate isomerase/epimerase
MAPEARPAPVSVFDPLRLPAEVRIGIGSVEWRWSKLADILVRLHRYGVQCVELVGRKNVFTESLAEAQALLAEWQIQPNAVSAFTKLNEAVHERVRETQDLINECIDLAAGLRAPYTVTYCGTNALRDDAEAIARYAEFVRPCLRQAEDKGVVLLIENLFDAVPSEIPAAFRQRYRSSDVTRTARGCLHLLETVDSPWFRFNYDPGNFLIGGEEPYPYAYELLKDYICNIHLRMRSSSIRICTETSLKSTCNGICKATTCASHWARARSITKHSYSACAAMATGAAWCSSRTQGSRAWMGRSVTR